jgi:hypothetical protein
MVPFKMGVVNNVTARHMVKYSGVLTKTRDVRSDMFDFYAKIRERTKYD